MIIERCQKNRLDNLKVDYVIIGYKNTGIRSLPPKYEMHTIYANKDDVYEKVTGFIYFRIFDVSESVHSMKVWKDHFDDYMKAKKESEERELYERLKKQFE